MFFSLLVRATVGLISASVFILLLLPMIFFSSKGPSF